MRFLRAALLLLALTGCAAKPQPSTDVTFEAALAQLEVAEATVPAIVDVRAAIAEIAPPPPTDECYVHPDAVALIVRFEVTSPAYYSARLEGVIWPGLQSGATWGVGYDGGHQTRTRIVTDWHEHTHAERLASTAGVIGPRAKDLLPGLADVRTPYPLAASVFEAATLPTYCRLAERTFKGARELLPERAFGAIVATVFNRGVAMNGDKRREMKTIRDVCVPAGDVACLVREFRSMPRLWVGTPAENGLRNRYFATAELAGRI